MVGQPKLAVFVQVFAAFEDTREKVSSESYILVTATFAVFLIFGGSQNGGLLVTSTV